MTEIIALQRPMGHLERIGFRKNELWFKQLKVAFCVNPVQLCKIPAILCAMVMMLGTYSATATSADADYLSAISSEANKVESDSLSGLGGSDKDGTELDTARTAFETDLKTKYRGSYTFYKKLPRPGRDEIYQSYKEGASISAIREKIMDRFLQR